MTTEKVICPVCDEGELVVGTYADDFKHNNGTVHVENLECCFCSVCGADPVLPEQVRRNHLKVADAKRRQDGLLTGDEVRAVREMLGLSQQQASELFGGGANAFSKYERGDVIQSVAMDRLLKVAVLCPDALDLIRVITTHGDVQLFRSYSSATEFPVIHLKDLALVGPAGQRISAVKQDWTAAA